MKNILKKISATLAILAILGMSTASAGVSSRDGQLMFNGNFEAGYTAFTNAEGIGSSVAKFEPTAQGSLAMRATYNSNTGQAWVYTTAATITATDTAGYNYRIKGMARGDGTLAPRLTRTNSSGAICALLWEGTASTDTQYFDVVFSTSSCSNRIGFDSATNSAGWVEFDNVSITRYYGALKNRDTQLVVNGSFEDGTTNWTASNGATLSSVNGVGGIGSAMRIDAGSTTSRAISSFSASPGVSYRIRGYARSDGTSVPQGNWVGHSSFSLNLVPALPTSFTFFDVVVVAPVGSSWQFALLNNNATSSGWVEFDNISITPYYGTVQNRDVNLFPTGNMENAGVAEYSLVNAPTLTKESGSADYQGTQVLKVAYNGTGLYYAQISSLPTTSLRVRGWLRSDGTVRPRVVLGGSTQFIGDISTTWQYFDIVGASPTGSFYMGSPDASGWAEFDNITITRVY